MKIPTKIKYGRGSKPINGVFLAATISPFQVPRAPYMFWDQKRFSRRFPEHVGRRGKTCGSGRVGFELGQSGCESKWVIFKWVNQVTGRGSSRVANQVELSHIFQTSFFFFFFEIDAICQLFMSFLTVIRFSLVILFLITTKHLIPKFGATLVPAFQKLILV